MGTCGRLASRTRARARRDLISPGSRAQVQLQLHLEQLPILFSTDYFLAATLSTDPVLDINDGKDVSQKEPPLS